MQETVSVKHVRLAILAIAMAAIVAFGMCAFAQTAQAEPALPYGKTKVVTTGKVKITYYNGNSAAGVAVKAVKAPASVKKITIPDTVKINNHTYKVTQIQKNAFKGAKGATKVVLGKNVGKIKANAFAKSKVTKVVVKKDKMGKKYVKGAFKGSKVKVVKTPNAKVYKKIFTKKIVGKKVTVK